MYGQSDANILLDQLLESNRKGEHPEVLVYVDPDIDGVVAARIIMVWLQFNGIHYKWFVNKERMHGYFLNKEQTLSYFDNPANGWIIHGDFTITEDKAHEICSWGLRLLSTDHHEVPDGQGYIRVLDNEGALRGCVINNQYEFEPEDQSYDSGAGVILRVLRGYSGQEWGGLGADRLTAWTLLSDVRDLSGEQAKEALRKLYSWRYSSQEYNNALRGIASTEDDFFRGILTVVVSTIINTRKNYNFGLPKIDRTFVDFVMSPTLNSLFRFGKEESAVEIFEGGSIPIAPFGYESFQKFQRAIVDKMTQIASVKFFGNNLCVWGMRDTREGYFNEGHPNNFIGLACSRLVDKYGRCTIGMVLDKNNKVVRASFRGNGSQGIPFRELLAETSGIHGEGHSSAFGIPTLDLKEADFKTAGEIVDYVLNKYADVDTRIIAESDNLLRWFRHSAWMAAEHNEFCNASERMYLKYTGSAIRVEVSKGTYTKLLIDGQPVKYFGPLADLQDGTGDFNLNGYLITPTVDSSRVVLTLRKG